MLLIFFNTVIFYWQYWHWKKSSTLLFTQQMWNHRSQVSQPKKSFATPSSSPQALHSQSSSSSSFSTSSSLDDSGGMYHQFLFSPCVQTPPPLFLTPPLALTPLPCFFWCSFSVFLSSRSSFLFCFASSACLFCLTFSLYISTCLSLVKRCDFVTTQGCFCFDWFISGNMNESYKFTGMTPVASSGLMCIAVGDVWFSCWLEEVDGWGLVKVAADCCCGVMLIALSPLKRLLLIASLSSGNIPHFWNPFFYQRNSNWLPRFFEYSGKIGFATVDRVRPF